MEKFDALDKNGNKLGFKIIRGEAIPKHVYFGIVTILTYGFDHKLLVTKRNINKPSGGLWEITGGGIQAGETALAAARRELGEETGIWLQEKDFIYLDKESNWPFVCNSFVVKLDSLKEIKLDPKETIDYKWLDLADFFKFVKSKDFVLQIGERIINHQKEIIKIINKS